MSYIFISNYVPLNIVSKNRALEATHNFKHFDAFKTAERILPWQQAPQYRQKWQKNDIIFIQIESDFDPINIKLIDSEGSIFQDFVTTIKAVIDGRIYSEAAIALDLVPKGVYKVDISGGGIELESECLEVAEQWPGTLLYKFNHNTNKGMLWQTGIYILLRVEGTIALFNPIGARTVYIDTPYNSRTVKGYSARSFINYIGDESGVPDYIADKIQDAYDCNNLTIDGKGFTAKDDGTKLVAKREEDVAFAGWSIEITEALNRRGKRFEATGIIEKRVVVDYIVEGKLFGPIYGSANNNTYTLKKVE